MDDPYMQLFGSKDLTKEMQEARPEDLNKLIDAQIGKLKPEEVDALSSASEAE